MFQNTTSPAINWNILPNSSSSLWGNSCYDDKDPNNQGVFQWLPTTPPTTAQVGTPSNGPPSAQYAAALPSSAFTSPYNTNAAGILCEGDAQLNKTGTLMVASPEPSGSNAPQNVSVTLKGEGYQAIFLGVLL